MTQIVAHDSDSKVVSKRTESVLTTCLVVYYIGACLGVFTVNHEIGFGYYALEMSAKYFGAPLLLAVYFGLRLTFFRRQSRRSMIWALVVAMFVASSMILLSFGYFSLVNAYVGKQEAIILSGAIVKKKVYGVRRTMYGVVGDFAGRRGLMYPRRRMSDLRLVIRLVRT